MARRLWQGAGDAESLRLAYYDLLLPADARSFLALTPARHALPPEFGQRFERQLTFDLGRGAEDGASGRGPAAAGLPFPDASLDCILVAGTLDGIDAAGRRAVLRDAHRTLAARGAVVIETANPFDLRRFASARLARGTARAQLARPAVWRRQLREAGFSEVAVFALAERPNGALAVVSTAHGAAGAHYRRDYPPEFCRRRTARGWLLWLLARLQAMRFTEPSFLFLARK